MRNRLLILLSIIVTSTIPVSLQAQRYFNSPLSRFNLGTFEKSGSFRSLGMGGTGMAIRTNDNLYSANPASYSALDTNSFVFDFAVDYSILSLSDNDRSYKSDDIGFNHLTMGFPVAKNFGVALGIEPYSNSYYNLSKNDEFGSSVDHHGNGGLTKIFIGTGAELFEGLSLGLNMNILYGEITRENYYLYKDSRVNNILSSEYLFLKGLVFDAGIQYGMEFENGYFFNIGAGTTFGNDLKSNYSIRAETYNTAITNTLYHFSDDSTKAVLPNSLNAGISFGIADKLVLAADYLYSAWSGAKIYGAEDCLADSRSLRFGVEYIPDKYSYSSLVDRFEYRLGFHIDNNYLKIGSGQVKDYGITGGIGIPMRRSYSKVNLFIDYSRKSVPSGSSVTHLEDCLTFGISMNIYENYWFVKTRFE